MREIRNCAKHGDVEHEGYNIRWDNGGQPRDWRCIECHHEEWRARRPWDRKYVMEALGLGRESNAKLPAAMDKVVFYNGFNVRAYPKGLAPRGLFHRVLVECHCGRMIPFGRMHQHRKACKAEVDVAA